MTVRNPASRSEPDGYRGRRIAIGTRHGKGGQFAPAFAAVLGAEVVTPTDLDTDQFGTFSAEVARTMAAVDTARAKARLAIDTTGLAHGLATEASYGPLPGTVVTGHEEIALFIDDALGIEVVEGYRTASPLGTAHRVRGLGELPPAVLAALPAQGVIVRPSTDGPTADVVKGVTTPEVLTAAIAAATGRSPEGVAVVEPDLRAHHNATRRIVLTRLARILARRLATRCPQCGAPGFGRIGSEPGLPCLACDTPTTLPHGAIHSCAACPHREMRPMTLAGADPRWCPACNP